MEIRKAAAPFWIENKGSSYTRTPFSIVAKQPENLTRIRVPQCILAHSEKEKKREIVPYKDL